MAWKSLILIANQKIPYSNLFRKLLTGTSNYKKSCFWTFFRFYLSKLLFIRSQNILDIIQPLTLHLVAGSLGDGLRQAARLKSNAV